MKLELLAYIFGVLAVVFGQDALSQSLLTQAYLTCTAAETGGTRTNSLNLTIGIGPEASWDGSRTALLFEHLFVETNDVGHIYTIGPGDDPDFAAFAFYLTDDHVSFLSEFAAVGPGGSGEFGLPETKFFVSLPPGNNGIDLNGFAIDYFSLCFNTLSITSPGGGYNWTDSSYTATFSVYGQPVPEPAPVATFCLGVAALMAKALRGKVATDNAGWRSELRYPGSPPCHFALLPYGMEK